MTKELTARSAIVVLLLFCAHTALAQNISFIRSKEVVIPVSFIPPPGSGTYYSFASGDFNGDGKLDFVVSYTNVLISDTSVNSNLSAVLLLGNGDGTFKSIDLAFAAKVIISTGTGNQGYVLAVDVNVDKKLDLIMAIGQQTYLFLGNGDGTFQPAKPLPAFPKAVADFNGDGKPDLLTSEQVVDGQQCYNGSLNVYPGNGDGTFRSSLPCSADTGDGDWGTRNIVVGDLNGDGKLDVVWGNIRGTGRLFVWLGNGDGTFRPPYGVMAQATHGGKPVALGDLTHDGKLDLVLGTQFGIAVLLGNGDGTFQSNYPATAMGGLVFLPYFDGAFNLSIMRSWLSNDIFIRDFDGDGNQDILLDDVLFRGRGDGTFLPAQFVRANSSEAFPNAISVICEDLNGDGKPDIVYLPRVVAKQSNATYSIPILLNNSPNVIGNNVLGYSAASGGGLLAPASIASIYGKNLAKVTASAPRSTLPTQLGGISLRVRDSSDMVRLAQLILVSPTQINFVMPPETSIGPATLTIDDGSVQLQEGANATIVVRVAPGFFTANQNGVGVPAATAVRIRADQTQEPVAVFSCASTGQCNASPIDLTNGLVYLSLYGTGFGLTSSIIPSTEFPRCQVGDKTDVKVQFAGPHSLYPGLNQLNLLIPQSLSSGQASIQCLFSGAFQSSNVVSIAIK